MQSTTNLVKRRSSSRLERISPLKENTNLNSNSEDMAINKVVSLSDELYLETFA
jgi:hypothetical protein